MANLKSELWPEEEGAAGFGDLGEAFEKPADHEMIVLRQEPRESREAFELRVAQVQSERPGATVIAVADELPERWVK